MPYTVNRRASAAAKRAENGRKTRLRTLAGRHAAFFTPSALQRLAALEEPSPPEPRRYALTAVAAALDRPEQAVLAMIGRGRIPEPDRWQCGAPSWGAAIIEPWLQRRGVMPVGVQRDREVDARREPRVAFLGGRDVAPRGARGNPDSRT